MKITFLFTLLVLLFYSCNNIKSDKSIYQIEKSKDSAVELLTKNLDSLLNTGVFNGFSVAVVDSTGVLYNQGFGYADVSDKKKFTKNTIINIASISKVFVGIALLKAQELNFIDLDAPINKYLPFEIVNPHYPDKAITIRQLATHSSSIIDTESYMQTCYINKDNVAIAENLKEKYELYYQNPSKDWIPLAEYLRKLLDKDGILYDTAAFANRKPGETYKYSNLGTALCALVIEYACQKPFSEFTKEYIFDPLKMSSTTWFFEESDSKNYSKLYYDDQELPYYKILSYPDGGLITSSTDLSKFLVDLIKGYSGNGTILTTDGYKEFFRSQLNEKAFEKDNYNVGIFIEKELAYNDIGHTGGDPGTNTLMYFNTETKKGKILILNTDSQKENSMDIYWGIWQTLNEYKTSIKEDNKTEQDKAMDALNEIQVSGGGKLYSTFANIAHSECKGAIEKYVISSLEFEAALLELLNKNYPHLPIDQRQHLASTSAKAQKEYSLTICGTTTSSKDTMITSQAPRQGTWIFPAVLEQRDVVVVW